MKEWFTAAEIAEAGMAHMPKTRKGVSKFAEREGWNDHPSLARRRKGRGGGMEYHLSLLPTLAQMVYTQKHLSVSLPPAPGEAPPPVETQLSARARIERDARLAVLQTYATFSRGLGGLSEAARMSAFCDRYAMGYVEVEPWVRELLPTPSPRSLRRWKDARRRAPERLGVDRSSARSGTGVLDTANDGKVKAFILALLAQNQHLAAAQVRTLCRDEFGDTLTIARRGETFDVAMPPVRAFQRVMKAYKTAFKVPLTKLQNPDHFRSTMKPSGTGSLKHVRHPNALWQIDASPLDALCTDGRHSIYACIDIATRRTLIYVSKTPRASAVGLLLRKALIAWGVPDTIKTDNGSDFTARDTKRLLASLDIEMDISDAYSPEQKGHVERVIGTFQRSFATLVPGFVGHSVADRKAIEGRKSFSKRLRETEAEVFEVAYSGAEMQTLADKWSSDFYQHQRHSGLGGKTPFQAAAESELPIRKVDETALDLLLMPVAGGDGYRVTTKFGIRVDGFHYATPNILPSTRVFVRQDPNDKGRVYAFEEDGGRFLGEGVCPQLAGINPATWLQGVKEAQDDLIKSATRQMKRDMRAITRGPALIERVLKVAARDVPNVVPLPKRENAHSTPQIAAALLALDTNAQLLRAKPTDAAVAAKQRELIASMEAGEGRALAEVTDAIATRPSMPANTNVHHLPETPKQRYRRALDVMRAVTDGDSVDPTEALWVGGYRQSAEFRAQARMHKEFGEAYLGAS